VFGCHHSRRNCFHVDSPLPKSAFSFSIFSITFFAKLSEFSTAFTYGQTEIISEKESED
jgi:hypothetical protein